MKEKQNKNRVVCVRRYMGNIANVTLSKADMEWNIMEGCCNETAVAALIRTLSTLLGWNRTKAAWVWQMVHMGVEDIICPVNRHPIQHKSRC